MLAPDLLPLLAPPPLELQPVVDRFRLDREALLRRYLIRYSPAQNRVLRRFYDHWLCRLAEVDYHALSLGARVDYHLLRNRIAGLQCEIEREKAAMEEMAPLLPFAASIVDLEARRRRLRAIDPREGARTLASLHDEIQGSRSRITGAKGERRSVNPEHGSAIAVGAPAPDDSKAPRPEASSTWEPIQPSVALRAVQYLSDLRESLKNWFAYHDGYDPLFSWWARSPYRGVDEALETYIRELKENLVGYREGEEEPIVGLPLGREALESDLRHEMIPYSPEELIALAEEELAWCDVQIKQAAAEMGLGDDWRTALERVKDDFVPPGDQPRRVRNLQYEGLAFVRKHDLVTVPPLVQATWRMEMMSAERQKVNPFFLGGESIIVSFPTDSMSQEEKRQSLRANNVHFARATVFHEMIPGHHLQGFMLSRYCGYRREFNTPFWIEGTALYWEIVFWNRGFFTTPEDRIGHLFWHRHRAGRVIFSLNFHLGRWTADRCIDYLAAEIGHERASATAEVRRSFNGSYPPLYQAAYLVGCWQFRALRQECVESGRMSEKAFHDFIYTHGSIPVAMVRALLDPQPLPVEGPSPWRFAENLWELRGIEHSSA